MRILQRKSIVPWHGHRAQQGLYGPGETQGYLWMANSNVCQGNPIIPWTLHYYRRFIKDYANWAKALNNCLQKDLPFAWPDKCQQSFDGLKACFAKEPVLMIPDPTQPFQIESDTSLYTTGAVLSQLDGNGDRHPCSFILKTFSLAKRNYKIYNQELLAIIRALTEWCHYIQGSAHTTVIHSNHKNLTYFRSAQKLNHQQAQWSLYLSEFNLQLIHVPGNKMVVSDALSHRADHCSGNEHNNEDITLLPDFQLYL